MDTTDAKDNKSIESLHASKSKQNITMEETTDSSPFKETDKVGLPVDIKPPQDSRIETVFEKLDLNSGTRIGFTDSDTGHPETGLIEVKPPLPKPTETNKNKIDIPPLQFDIKDRTSTSVIENTTVTEVKNPVKTDSIYSINGSPSGRIIRRRDNSSNVFPVGCMGCKEEEIVDVNASPRRFLDAQEASNDHAGHIKDTPRKRPSSAKIDSSRNPLTGEGVERVELRRQSSKRKDGNPLLGIGYEESPKTISSRSRVPPGGYSHGLW